MLPVNESFVKCIIDSDLYVPNLRYRLFFVGVMHRTGNYVLFDEGQFKIEDCGTIIGQCQGVKDLNILRKTSTPARPVFK